MRNALVLVLAATAFCLPRLARAEGLLLKNGQELHGKVLEDKDESIYVLETEFGTLRLDRSKVLRPLSTEEDVPGKETAKETPKKSDSGGLKSGSGTSVSSADEGADEGGKGGKKGKGKKSAKDTQALLDAMNKLKGKAKDPAAMLAELKKQFPDLKLQDIGQAMEAAKSDPQYWAEAYSAWRGVAGGGGGGGGGAKGAGKAADRDAWPELYSEWRMTAADLTLNVNPGNTSSSKQTGSQNNNPSNQYTGNNYTGNNSNTRSGPGSVRDLNRALGQNPNAVLNGNPALTRFLNRYSNPGGVQPTAPNEAPPVDPNAQ